MTTWRTRISRCLPTAANTHSEYVVLIDFPLQQWLYDRNSMLRNSTFPVFCILAIDLLAHMYSNVNVTQAAYITVYTRCVICCGKTSDACIQMFNFGQHHQSNHNATVSMASAQDDDNDTKIGVIPDTEHWYEH